MRPRQLEWLTEARVQLERLLESSESIREIAPRGRDQPSAPGCDDSRPEVLESLTSFLELAQQRGRLLELPECDERLDRVTVEAEEGGLPDPPSFAFVSA